MGIVIPRRIDPNTGQPVYTTQANYDEMVGRYNANQSFQDSLGAGIPGLTAPVSGTFNGRPIPPSPTSGGVNIPGYGNVSVPYTPGFGDAALSGRPPPDASGWHPTGTRQLFGGLLSQYMNESMGPQQWAGTLQQGQAPPAQQQQQTFMPNGMYGRQAMQLAGTYSPNTPPGDTYPNGLLGGKGGGFRPGGK